MNLVRFGNKYFNDNEPWKLLKDNPGRCALAINLCLQTVASAAILTEPILPFSASAIWKMLNLPEAPSDSGWKSAGIHLLKDGHRLGEPRILFSKIEDEVIAKYLPKPSAPAELPIRDAPPTKAAVGIDTFRTLDLRIARVIAAERIPKSDKLLKLRVSTGNEERQIVAGIAQHYAPEDLVGKKIVIVANLAPAKIMGQESQGMLLAASDHDGRLAILVTERDMAEGSSVK